MRQQAVRWKLGAALIFVATAAAAKQLEPDRASSVGNVASTPGVAPATWPAPAATASATSASQVPISITISSPDTGSSTAVLVGLITGTFTLAAAGLTSYMTNIVAEKNRRRLDAANVAAGIAGELASSADGAVLLRAQLQQQVDAAAAGQQLRFRRFPMPGDLFFERHAERLGLLGPELVESVVYVYNNMRAFRVAYTVITEQHQEMTPEEIEVRLKACLAAIERAIERGRSLLPKLHARAKA